MSFLSSLCFYRPTAPPSITPAVLGEFLKRLDATGICRPTLSRFNSVKASFGRSVDQDDEQKLGVRVHQRGSIIRVSLTDEKWDVVLEPSGDDEALSLAGLASALKRYKHGFLRRVLRTPDTLYRARCGLGIVAEPIWQSVMVVPENNGSYPLRLDNWSFDLGPVLLYPDPTVDGADDVEAIQVGWMGIRLSGQGSRGAQIPAQIIARAQAQPAIQAMMRLCRELWPVEPTPVPDQVIASRRMLGIYWPYGRLDEPWDWYWGFRES